MSLANRILAASDHTEVLVGRALPSAAVLSDSDINAYFRRLAFRLHPDKLLSASSSLTEAEHELAKRAFERAQQARQALATVELRLAFDTLNRKIGQQPTSMPKFEQAPTAAASSSASPPSCPAAEQQPPPRQKFAFKPKPQPAATSGSTEAEIRARDQRRKSLLDPLAAVERQLAEEKSLYEQMFAQGDGDSPQSGRRKRRRT